MVEGIPKYVDISTKKGGIEKHRMSTIWLKKKATYLAEGGWGHGMVEEFEGDGLQVS